MRDSAGSPVMGVREKYDFRFLELSDRRGPGETFPRAPWGGCPEDWGFDIALPRQRIALLGRKKARKFLAFLWSQQGLNL